MITPEARRATRFFWVWLIAASAASVAGNVAHAMLAAPRNVWIAALAAVVPPAVLLGAMHGVTLLVRARTVGAAYWFSLFTTTLLAIGAFVLSFDALRALAEQWAGYRSWTAWVWPLVIDLFIASSTVSLLALTGRPHPSRSEPEQHGASPSVAGASHAPENGNSKHRQRADALIRSGVTNAGSENVAGLLLALDQGVAPSTAARKFGMGYETVRRIRDADPQLQEQR